MKTRLTITLSRDIVQKIDQLIDGQNIRNRSHAIEYLTHQSLVPAVRTAVVLTGGPSTGKSCPSLEPIDRQPLVTILIQHLKSYGIITHTGCA
ncbi:MAG: hypothetical protein UV63_C0004G0027 [Microgenomates group bacterium GW2011_GWC1_43_11]|uniref:Uncharacterized protein n=1 Tax=Candidatus Gottesmanbacteria bacterium GW2011_GWB1_44_11c TaxID=1618447 RepID=A0A0G1JMG4_9BACT|nr:MAG: hypothetical protein UV63_C0004G0027 [Microgenomates group bacterium GW2011_GWC1_43_11]KKT36614.1 MAG: hypothetical protein UW22_C0036G0002 [Candidatus Gottesmanbacteria bacterium GW2011_GWB1_44_11c]HCM81789.1 hypothetical protein [Patescibacteria group bacterium]